MAEQSESERQTVASDRVADGHLPVGWVVDERAATFIVSREADIDFVVSGSLVRLLPGDAIGSGRHVLISDADNPPEGDPDAKTLVERYGIVCEILEQAAADSLEGSVTETVTDALAHGRRPRDPENSQQRQQALSQF